MRRRTSAPAIAPRWARSFAISSMRSKTRPRRASSIFWPSCAGWFSECRTRPTRRCRRSRGPIPGPARIAPRQWWRASGPMPSGSSGALRKGPAAPAASGIRNLLVLEGGIAQQPELGDLGVAQPVEIHDLGDVALARLDHCAGEAEADREGIPVGDNLADVVLRIAVVLLIPFQPQEDILPSDGLAAVMTYEVRLVEALDRLGHEAEPDLLHQALAESAGLVGRHWHAPACGRQASLRAPGASRQRRRNSGLGGARAPR